MENLPSDGEMAVRLAALKGLPAADGAAANNVSGKGFYHAPERRVPDAQRADELMGRMAEEVAMASRARGAVGGGAVDPARDIAERLAKLRGLSVRLHFGRTRDHDHIL